MYVYPLPKLDMKYKYFVYAYLLINLYTYMLIIPIYEETSIFVIYHIPKVFPLMGFYSYLYIQVLFYPTVLPLQGSYSYLYVDALFYHIPTVIPSQGNYSCLCVQALFYHTPLFSPCEAIIHISTYKPCFFHLLWVGLNKRFHCTNLVLSHSHCFPIAGLFCQFPIVFSPRRARLRWRLSW